MCVCFHILYTIFIFHQNIAQMAPEAFGFRVRHFQRQGWRDSQFFSRSCLGILAHVCYNHEISRVRAEVRARGHTNTHHAASRSHVRLGVSACAPRRSRCGVSGHRPWTTSPWCDGHARPPAQRRIRGRCDHSLAADSSLRIRRDHHRPFRTPALRRLRCVRDASQ
jgi:hypothetical protein